MTADLQTMHQIHKLANMMARNERPAAVAYQAGHAAFVVRDLEGDGETIAKLLDEIADKYEREA